MRYLDLDIKTINEKLKNKEIKPIDLVNEAFNRIEETNLNCFITLNKEQALKKAKELEEKEVDNILFGLPIAIKDNIVTKDLRTTAASHILEDFIPIYDATVITKIKEKNMIIIGKTNMDEFAMGSTGETSYFGNTLNPIDNTLVPGGSSSGSAACVAAGITPFSLGTDTGGSIRQPSSFCGLVGLKPTYGRVSRYGVIAFASSLDQVGPITRNVYENALLLNVISGKDKNDLTSSNREVKDYTSLIGKDITNLKIAVPNYYMSEVIDKTVREKIINVINLLKEKGCQVDYVDIDYLEYAIPLYQVIALGEASSNLARYDGIRYGLKVDDFRNIDELYKNTRTIGFGNEVKRRIMIGSYILSGENANVYYYKALKLRKEMTDSFVSVLSKYDLIIGPTNTDVAYKLGTKQDDALKSFYDDLLTIPVNMAGLPALSLPVGYKNNLPVGMHIIGNYFEEDKIYQLASYIENELKEEK
ncbi:MAG TPA: Asp-tRNA(Asn)/Glu-tRNA(Gln) amidotransferase subunit GatA [Candidatus Faecisoma merdavium]|nr:Asp-tRNA(Asn)/Glu-tRNA(Gln) amidotransferase subunit GatA [Candidatus Faecisoma merdavium]